MAYVGPSQGAILAVCVCTVQCLLSVVHVRGLARLTRYTIAHVEVTN